MFSALRCATKFKSTLESLTLLQCDQMSKDAIEHVLKTCTKLRNVKLSKAERDAFYDWRARFPQIRFGYLPRKASNIDRETAHG